MENKTTPLAKKTSTVRLYKEKMEFLKLVLDSEMKLRTSIENKSSILIGANAIILGAMTGFFLPLISTDNPLIGLQIFFTIVTIGSALSSVFLCAEVLHPFRSQKQRNSIMDLGTDPDNEFNLFWFVKIAEQEKQDYKNNIEIITSDVIISQITNEIHNLSRILRQRYKYIQIANIAFVMGLASFSLVALTKLIHP